MINPTALYQITGADLKALASELAKSLQPETQIPPYMDSRQAKQVLKEKGFKVSSENTFKKIVEDMGLTREKKGKSYWYITAEINNIPKRTK